VIDFFNTTPSRANFLTAFAFSKTVGDNPAENKENAAVFANRIS